MPIPTVFESNITSLPLLARGKVRDIYAVNDELLLIVTSDRLSAFDVILPDPIPGKGAVLTAVANFWFGKLAHVIPNQLTGIDPESVVADTARDPVPQLREHVLLPVAGSMEDADARLAGPALAAVPAAEPRVPHGHAPAKLSTVSVTGWPARSRLS